MFGGDRLRINSPDSSPSLRSPARIRAPFLARPLARYSPLFFVLGFLAVLAVPALYTHHRNPDLLPSFFTASVPAHIVTPSGGNLELAYTLEARLSDLLARPALAQWEAELPSRHACPMFTYSRNTYFFHTDDKFQLWGSIGPTDVRRYRSKMVEYLRKVERSGKKLVWEKSMEDGVPKELRRGLIMSGGEKSLARIKLSLDMLRNVIGSKIPIELYHFPDEFTDADARKQLEEEYDIALKTIQAPRSSGDKAWNIKTEALIATHFTEIVYLDSDNIPLRDPMELFDSVEYKQSGSVFWPDLNKDHPDNAMFRIVGRYCSDSHWPAEAGQLLFDKRGNNGLNLAVLHLANHMQTQQDMYGQLMYGDKDTFRFAFYALGLDYQMATKMFASAGGYQTATGENSATFSGHSMLHWGLTPPSKIHDKTYHPEPFFIHTILAKYRTGLQPSRLFSHIRRPRLDGVNEPLLVRTLYEFNGLAFTIDLKGPDGGRDSERSMGDGQGVDEVRTRDVVHSKVWTALEQLSETFVTLEE